ncbi:MAG: type II secretion system F family protein [Phycisphaeraceae bacterium]
MAVYVYTAWNEAGRRSAPIHGTITADSPRQARDQLRSRGLTIKEVAEHETGGRAGWRERYLSRRQAVHVTGLFQEMSTLLGAGIPLLETLDTITRQHTGRFQQSIMLLRDHVAAGGGLAEAMGLQPMLFDALCLNIVEVGENAGTLDAALEQLVSYRRRSAGLKNRVASALMYPCIVLSAGVVLSIFMMTYVMPNLLTVLQASGKPLPMATVVVKAISDFLIGWWWALLLGLGLAGAGIGAVLRSERGGLAWHRFQLKVPLLGDLIRKQSIARMSMVMATLLKSDVTFVRAVQISQRTVHNRVLRGALEACEQAVMAGRDIAAALEKTAAFPPLVIQVFAVGQASGRLESMLDDLAWDYDTQVEITSARLTALLEPIMVMGLAVVVGFIAFSTILPILEAGDVL